MLDVHLATYSLLTVVTVDLATHSAALTVKMWPYLAHNVCTVDKFGKYSLHTISFLLHIILFCEDTLFNTEFLCNTNLSVFVCVCVCVCVCV